jgi:hypothetical protein
MQVTVRWSILVSLQVAALLATSAVAQKGRCGDLTDPPSIPEKCHPDYPGACVPIDTDVDCFGRGRTGNGPSCIVGPFPHEGPDPYRLDADSDGTACE